nr:hypothetical protein [Sphingomonas sp. S2M10]
MIEVIHIVVGLIAAVVIASLAAWSYRRATHDIWLVAYVAMVAVVAMGIGPLRRAYAEDRAKLRGTEEAARDD